MAADTKRTDGEIAAAHIAQSVNASTSLRPLTREQAIQRNLEGRERVLAMARASRESSLTLEQRQANAYRGSDR